MFLQSHINYIQTNKSIVTTLVCFTLYNIGGSGQVEFCITDLVELNEGSQSPGPMVTEEGPPSGESLATAVKALKLRRQVRMKGQLVGLTCVVAERGGVSRGVGERV